MLSQDKMHVAAERQGGYQYISSAVRVSEAMVESTPPMADTAEYEP